MWTNLGKKSEIGVREVNSTFNEKRRRGMVENCRKILASEEKATTTIIPKEDEVHNKKNLFPRAGKLILPHPSLATANTGEIGRGLGKMQVNGPEG